MITVGQPGYIANVTDVPNLGYDTVGYSPANDVVITFNSFSEAAAAAGFSRRYGGIHVPIGDLDGRRMGSLIGSMVCQTLAGLVLNSTTSAPTTTTTQGTTVASTTVVTTAATSVATTTATATTTKVPGTTTVATPAPSVKNGASQFGFSSLLLMILLVINYL